MNKRSSESADSGPVYKDTAHILLETVPRLMGYVSSELRHHSIVTNPVHFHLLRMLRRRQRSIHELAEIQSVRLPTMSRTVSVMEGRGWIERVRSTEDRRTVLVSITESGNNVLQEVEEMAVSRASGLLELLSPKDLQNLKTGLESLQRVMSEHLGPDFEEDLIALKAKAREKYETS